MSSGFAGWCLVDLEPLKHIADLNREEFSLHLIQCNMVLYGFSCFSAMYDANRLYSTFAVGPIPHTDVKTSGENDLYFSNSFLTLPLLLHFLTSVALPYIGGLVALCKRLKTHTSKNARCLSSLQKFSATISSCAPSSLLTDLCLNLGLFTVLYPLSYHFIEIAAILAFSTVNITYCTHNNQILSDLRSVYVHLSIPKSIMSASIF